MLISIFVDGAQVGTRTGCDVLVGDQLCKKASVGAPYWFLYGKPPPKWRGQNDGVTHLHVAAQGSGP